MAVFPASHSFATMLEIEDARLATSLQIANRVNKVALLNPHLEGFTLTQLLDKVNQWCLAERHKPLCVGYRGTFGTLLLLSKHLATFFPGVTLVASVEQETIEPVAYRRLAKDHPNICFCTTSADVRSAEIATIFREMDVFVLAPYADFKHKRFRAFFEAISDSMLLDDKPCAIVDTVNARWNDHRGEYYMGSKVWVTAEPDSPDMRFENGALLNRRQKRRYDKLWRQVHGYSWKSEKEAIEWLACEVEPTVSLINTALYYCYLRFKSETRPDLSTSESCFKWCVDWHNALNAFLGKSVFTVQEAKARWWPHKHWCRKQPAIKDLVVVTSFSPLEGHAVAQRFALQSWLRLGLKVISGNSEAECKSLRKRYPDVEFREVESSTAFTRGTPKIRALMNLGGSSPILLINSDISIYGDQSLLVDAVVKRRALAGIRYNWEVHPGHGELEACGIDAFLLFPEQIETFPNLDLAIGQPFWDYWLPYHLEQKGFAFDWVSSPYFYHRQHSVYWDAPAYKKGNEIICSHYNCHVDFVAWRQSLPFVAT
jgi:hypothetical protein